MRYTEDIQKLVEKELIYAKRKHGNVCHNSEHEKYAVMLEEFDEVKVEIEKLQYAMDHYWRIIKADEIDSFNEMLKWIEERSMNAIEELVQVVAMAKKTVKCKEC